MNGMASSSAVAAARSASLLLTPPTTRMTCSSSTRCSMAAAAPSGSPRVSRTTTVRPEPSGKARAIPCRITSPQRLNWPESGTATPITAGLTVVSRPSRSSTARAADVQGESGQVAMRARASCSAAG